ncbi:MAG: helix-turn-helix domain-containing protein [Nocardioides sp.]
MTNSAIVIQRWTGLEARQLRQALRLSIEVFAERLGVSSRSIAKWEARGESLTQLPDTQAMLDTVLLRADADQRERFARGLAENEPKLTRRAVAEIASGLIAASLAGVAETASPTVVDPAVVEHFASLRALLVKADNRIGAITIHPTVAQQVGQIARLRRKAKGRLRDDLLGTEARWAEFAGWLSDDLGDDSSGARWLDLAMGLAQEAGDSEFVAYASARQAQRAIGTRDQDRVVGLARAATKHQHHSGPVAAFAAAQEAQGHALAGDAAAFQGSIQRARDIASANNPDGGELGSFCTSPYVHAHEADGWLRLKKPRSALPCFDNALAEWPESYPRERGLCLARMAAAYLSDDDPDQAADTGRRALAFEATTRSARIRAEVEAVVHGAREFHGRPAVKALVDALATQS